MGLSTVHVRRILLRHDSNVQANQFYTLITRVELFVCLLGDSQWVGKGGFFLAKGKFVEHEDWACSDELRCDRTHIKQAGRLDDNCQG